MAVTTFASAPSIASAESPPRSVRLWLAITLVLVFAMVMVGGATRLTGSGLSITEWKPVNGAIPPLSQESWQSQFDLYRQSPQYQALNRGMTLQEFKGIFWWEWGHRQLGRLIGLVFLAGFIWFALKRRFDFGTGAVLFAMGLLLGTQGLVGWIMVASGLQPGMTAVEPVKLALHLILACLFFASVLWMWTRLSSGPLVRATGAERGAAILLVVLAFAQIALGALVAGHGAGLTYNTWPLMDGRFIPTGLGLLKPLWLNLVDNITTIQFAHRRGAYVIVAVVLANLAIVVSRPDAVLRRRAGVLVALVLLQATLGILTLVNVVPLGLALAHQAMALLLLGAFVWYASAMTRAGRP
jgi:cytochrome c oxidase assembly protein subunit 15